MFVEDLETQCSVDGKGVVAATYVLIEVFELRVLMYHNVNEAQPQAKAAQAIPVASAHAAVPASLIIVAAFG